MWRDAGARGVGVDRWRGAMSNQNQLFSMAAAAVAQGSGRSGAMVPVEIAPDEGGRPRRTDPRPVIEDRGLAVGHGCVCAARSARSAREVGDVRAALIPHLPGSRGRSLSSIAAGTTAPALEPRAGVLHGEQAKRFCR